MVWLFQQTSTKIDATMKFLDWFVEEQARRRPRPRHDHQHEALWLRPEGLYDLDREYQARTYVQSASLKL